MSENITPAYREEKLLANIAGNDYEITPATRKEKLLSEIQGGGEKFIVNLIPDSPDFSGNMDKTVAEIYEAYQAGKAIYFRIYVSMDNYIDVPVTAVYANGAYTYPSFNAYLVTEDYLIYAFTGTANDGAKDSYAAEIKYFAAGEGLTLYGPYYFSNADNVTVAANSVEYVDCVILDYSASRTLPTTPITGDTKFLMATEADPGYGSLLIASLFSTPYYDDSDEVVSPASMRLLNVTNSSISVSSQEARVEFYCTVNLDVL